METLIYVQPSPHYHHRHQNATHININTNKIGDHVVELNGVPVSPTISDREFVEQLMSLSRPVVLGFTRQVCTYLSSEI
jgi:hypothetical protein